MCLVTLKEDPILIAEKDIIVYKGLIANGNKYTSPVVSFEYEIGKLYKTDNLIPDEVCTVTFTDTISHNYVFVRGKSGELVSYTKGFHSFLSSKRALSFIRDLSSCDLVGKFIIPKGSQYIDDLTGNIISNQIKFDSIHEPLAYQSYLKYRENVLNY